MNFNDTRHLLLAGTLVGGVLGTLTLAAVWQVDASESPDSPESSVLTTQPGVGSETPRPGAIPDTETPRLPDRQPAQAAHPEAQPLVAPPATRQLPADPPPRPVSTPRPLPEPPRKSQRPTPPPKPEPRSPATSSGGDWTLQFMVTCRAELVERLDQALGNDSRLTLAPVSLEGRACHRVCWGRYPSRDAAAQALDIPEALASLQQAPLPRLASGVTR